MIAGTENLTDAEIEGRLRHADAAGQRSLGKRVFKECRGHFCGFVETRPYLRARTELAMFSADSGRLPRQCATVLSGTAISEYATENCALALPI